MVDDRILKGCAVLDFIVVWDLGFVMRTIFQQENVGISDNDSDKCSDEMRIDQKKLKQCCAVLDL